MIEKKGADATDILAALLPKVITGFDWAEIACAGALAGSTWVRPLRAITATFGTDNDEPVVIPFEVDTAQPPARPPMATASSRPAPSG